MSIEETAPDPMAKARAAKAAKREAPPVTGRRISERARAQAELDAALIPTNAEEYRKQERALALLKAAEPAVDARIIQLPMSSEKHPQTKQYYRRDHIAISGDDLADVAPGGMSKKFRLGDRVRLTAEAADRLEVQGWIERL